MCLYFHRPSALVLSRKSRAIAKRKCRRPYDSTATDEKINHERRASADPIAANGGCTSSSTTSTTSTATTTTETATTTTTMSNDEEMAESDEEKSRTTDQGDGGDSGDEVAEIAATTATTIVAPLSAELKTSDFNEVNNDSNTTTRSDEEIKINNGTDAVDTNESSDTVDSIDNSSTETSKKCLVDESSVKLPENGNIKNEAEPMVVDDDDAPLLPVNAAETVVTDRSMPNDSNVSLPSEPQPNERLATRSKTVALVKRPELTSIIQKLINRVQNQPLNVVTTKSGPGASASMLSRNNDLYYHQQHVSPRKRILREFEKVSLEDSANNHHTKRSRSKCNVLNGVGGHHATGATIANASSTSVPPVHGACRTALINGNHSITPPSSDAVITKSTKLSSASSTAATPPSSRPFSSYSITSLLGHSVNNNNSISSNSSNSSNSGKIDVQSTVAAAAAARDSEAIDYFTRRISSRSPPTPVSPAHQSSLSSSRLNSSNAKKKPSTNGNSGGVAATVATQAHQQPPLPPSHRSPMNSPVNYGRSVTRSPNLSPSPEQVFRQHRSSQYNATLSSISSPTSGFHPYMPPTSRVSPSASGALSPPMPNDLHRYRNSYKTIGSPGSSIGAAHSYSSTSGSPSSYSARYSPSAYSQLSPPPASSASQQSKSAGSPYNISSFLQNAASIAANSRHREVSPPRSSSVSGLSTSTRTIPKKTASIRQQYDSPNSDKYSYAPSRSSSANDNSPPSTRSEPSPHASRRTLMDTVSAEQSPKSGGQYRSASPSETLRRQFEKEYSRAAELDRPPPPLIPSVHADGMPPPSPHHPYYGLYPTQSVGAAAAAAAAAAAYLPAYYHQMAFSAAAAYRNSMSWMHHPYPMPGPPQLSPTSRGMMPLAPDTPQLTQMANPSVYNQSNAYKNVRRPLAVPSFYDGVGGVGGNNSSAGSPAAVDAAQVAAWAAANPSAHALHHVNDAQPIPLLKEDSSAGTFISSSISFLNNLNNVFRVQFADVPLNLSKH